MGVIINSTQESDDNCLKKNKNKIQDVY